ncbi:MAG: ABC-type dipeptide transport system, periplasmic component [Bacteroidota bacterium]|jgi:peptide/nickel transport system substrate-binding protein|nr:ABC-type dipeptide transport system, periplasmic component [Bacteroidota bacterium]
MKNCFVYIFLALFAASCSSSDEGKNDTRTVFKYNEMGAVTSLDPAKASSFENIWVVNQIYNGLVEMNDSLSVEPSIASSWDISEDGLTYKFHLRENVFFHDNEHFGEEGKGRRVTASDFVYSFNRLLDPKVSNATTLLTYVNSETGKAFEAIDDNTFVIHMRQAFTPFLGILTMKYFSVIPKEVVEAEGEEFRRKPCGTGPFKFKMWEEGSKLVFVKNPEYFEYLGSERLPFLDAVSVSFIRDRESSFLNFLKGDLDMVSGVDAINTDEVLTADGKLKDSYSRNMKMLTQPFLETNYLGFFIDEQKSIVKNSPLKIKALRQAINYGFDRKKMVKYLRKNLGQAATSGFVPPGLPSFDESKVKGYDYNPDKVKELLFLAGYPDGKNLPEITLSTTEQYLELAEYIQSQLSEFGIKMKIDIQKASVLFEAIANQKVNFFRKSWNADYPDAENFLSLFYSKNWSPKGFNYTHYQNPQFDILYEKSQSELNDSTRYEYYRQMDQLLIDNAPVVPLYYGQVVRLVQNDVEGLTSNPMNMLSLKRVKKSKS